MMYAQTELIDSEKTLQKFFLAKRYIVHENKLQHFKLDLLSFQFIDFRTENAWRIRINNSTLKCIFQAFKRTSNGNGSKNRTRDINFFPGK